MGAEIGLAMAAAFGAAALSAVTGFGGAVLMLPVFVALFGARDAVAILTIAQLVSNGSRTWFNRDQVVRPVVGWFALGAVPAAIAGGLLFASAPLDALDRVIGGALLVLVVARRVHPARIVPSLEGFAVIGAVSGFGSALVGSLGPLTAPFFLAYGLAKGAYIGTEAASAVVIHLTKFVVYGAASVLTVGSTLTGVALAPAVAAGSWVGTRVVARLPAGVFVALVEAGLVTAGLLLLLDV